jgi:alpha-glucosidase
MNVILNVVMRSYSAQGRNFRLAALLLLAAGLVLGEATGKAAAGDLLTLKSPDGQITATIQGGAHLQYAVLFHGKPVVENSPMGIIINGSDLGGDAWFAGQPRTAEINESYPVTGVHATAINHCLATAIPISSGGQAWQLEVRIFNDGVAFRYRVPAAGSRHINGEDTAWNLPAGTGLWYQGAENTSYESRFENQIVGQLPEGLELMAPATVKFSNGAGYGMMTEADLINYSDLSLRTASNRFTAFFRNSPQGWDAMGDIVSPWRVTLLAATLNGLVNSDMIKSLCPPPAPELVNAPWIRPGRSVWHWLTGGAPKLEEQHAWIDGAKQLGYEYYLVDDGWRRWNGGGTNAWNALEGVVQYAKSQGVDIWAWVGASYVFDAKERMNYFKKARSIGIAGLKIDFPKPADPTWVNWYEDTLRDAASVQLMIDFHGAVKPTGRERTWPNEMSREAVAGREQGKNPSLHDTTLPFVRYVQGHADYTPTLLIPERLKGSSYAHELAMPVIFTSPYLCMGDNPKHYLESEASDVLKALPSVWDETIVLPPSEIGQLAVYARRHGNQWFIGALNNTQPRQVQISLDFLGSGGFKLVELADDPDREAAFARRTATVTRSDSLILPLRKDGGYVAWLVPQDLYSAGAHATVKE